MNKKLRNILIFTSVFLITLLLSILLNQTLIRKAESNFAYKPINEIKENEARNEKWGQNFPREYQSFLKTQKTDFVSLYNGSGLVDMLEKRPEFVVLWAGYGFSKDYNQPRGHYYAIEDLRNSLRTGAPTGPGTGPMPGTCWTCKSPDVPRLMNEKGIKEFYAGKWADKGNEVVNAVGCADCHDAKTMSLKITRPALVEAFQAMGKDINNSSHQEMRSLVCAQCHVEYYFNTKTKEAPDIPYLVFPWKNGLKVEDIEKYYDEINFTDWTHSLSKTPMLKAQHPDYEIYKLGIHAERGVSCADCHMPFRAEGGQKFTDHHIRSPLDNVSNSCQVCHRNEKNDIIKDVYERQSNISALQTKLEELLVRAHIEAKKAWELGAKEEQMKDILNDIRHAQFRWDYSVASHGGSFHAPLEVTRIVTLGYDAVQNARIKLSRLLAEYGFNKEVPYPDISTKAKAQEYIGYNLQKEKMAKDEFLKTIVPKWLEEAKEKQLVSSK